jgi:hypothetical protein
MPGEPGEVVLGALIPEVIQEEERIETFCLPETKGAAELHARPFHRGCGADELLDGSNGHASKIIPPAAGG